MTKTQLISYEARQLNSVIDFFFTNQVDEIKVTLKDPILISREEFEQIIGQPDSIWGLDDVIYTYDDEYVETNPEAGEEKVYRVFVNLNIKYNTYTKEDENKEFLEIYEIHGWREYKEMTEKEE